jgi:hypothetical protein
MANRFRCLPLASRDRAGPENVSPGLVLDAVSAGEL